MLCKKSKNEQEWRVRMKSIFLGDWIYKGVSYYKYQQKSPLKGALKNMCSWNSKINNNLKSI